jgi:CheY-like chemotaxis protein
MRKKACMKKKVLITDDDPGVQDVFRIIFQRAGYEVTVFSDGTALLAGTFELPDIFVLDKQLSGIDGLDICRHLKSREETRHIPIIMVSASPNIANMARAAGAEDFIEKPFRNKELVALVEKHVSARPPVV